MLIKSDFYVYRYIRLDTQRPVYVGKGRCRRAYNIRAHNQYCKNIHKHCKIKIELVFSNLSEDRAFELEKLLIKTYKSYGMCEANFDPGGRGNAGRTSPMKGKKHTTETKLKISLGNKGKIISLEQRSKIKKKLSNTTRSNEIRLKISKSKLGKPSPHIGKVYSEEIRLKMSKARLGKIPWNKGLRKDHE